MEVVKVYILHYFHSTLARPRPSPEELAARIAARMAELTKSDDQEANKDEQGQQQVTAAGRQEQVIAAAGEQPQNEPPVAVAATPSVNAPLTNDAPGAKTPGNPVVETQNLTPATRRQVRPPLRFSPAVSTEVEKVIQR